MSYMLPITTLYRYFGTDDHVNKYEAHIREVLAAFIGRGELYSSDAFQRATLPEDAAGVPLLSRQWDDVARAPRFLHGSPTTTDINLSAAPVRYPKSRAEFDQRAEWYAARYDWAIIPWSTSFHKYSLAFVTASAELADKFERNWRRHPYTGAWDRQHSDEDASTLLGVRRTDVPAESYRIALFSEWDHEGAALWKTCDCERRMPYFFAQEMYSKTGYAELVNWERIGFRVLAEPQSKKSHGAMVRSTLLQPVSREALFDILRMPEEKIDDDDYAGATIAGWTIFQGDPGRLPLIRPRRCEHGLEGIADMLEHLDWVYARHNGGGTGEYYEVFGARDPLTTSALMREIEASNREGDGVRGVF